MIFGETLTRGNLEKKIDGLEDQIVKTEVELKGEENRLSSALAQDSVSGGNRSGQIEEKIIALSTRKATLLRALPRAREVLEREVRAIERTADKKTREKALKEVEGWFEAATKLRAELYDAAERFVELLGDYKLQAFDAPSNAIVSNTYDIRVPFRVLRADTFMKNLLDVFTIEAREKEGVAKAVGQTRAVVERDRAAFDQYSREALSALSRKIAEVDREEAGDPDPLAQVAG